jgi:hypothetical protein
MSKLTDTKRAYDRVKRLLDLELVNRKSNAQEIRDAQAAVDAAFYLLGWGQFEYISRKEAEGRIKVDAASKTKDGIAWRYLKENIKSLSLRRKLELIFHGDKAILESLHRDYDIRNDATHNYKLLPAEARDISAWLDHLEKLVDRY